jgi:hypothetical protein
MVSSYDGFDAAFGMPLRAYCLLGIAAHHLMCYHINNSKECQWVGSVISAGM